MGKVVGFVGYESEDIVIYLAKILYSLGKKVAIVDRTEQEMLIEILELQDSRDEPTREGEYCGIRITNHGVRQEEYDLIFFLFGYRFIHPKLYECESLIMVTDGVPAHASLLRKVGHWECKQYLLIRNLVPMKHTEEYLVMLTSREENYGEVPYDEQDIRLRCSLSAYVECKVRRLSSGMKKALVALVCFLTTDYSERSVRETMRKI